MLDILADAYKYLSNVNVLGAWIFGAIFVSALVHGLAGFAFSAIAGALLMQWLAPTAVVPLLLQCSIIAQLLIIAGLRRMVQWRRCVPYLIGGFAGIPLGAALLSGLNPRAFTFGFGAFLVTYSVYMLIRPGMTLRRGGRFHEVVVGFAGGISGGAIAFPGAIPTIWCNLRALPKQEQQGIIQPFILIMQIASLIYLSKLGLVTADSVISFLSCLPAVLVGTWLGLLLFHRINDAMFRRVVLVVLLVSGGILLL